MKLIGCIVSIMCLLASCKQPPAGDFGNYDQLKEGFINPPVTARPKVYWWWLNGQTDTARLKEELLAIKNAGLGGVDIFEIGVPQGSNPDNIIKAGPAFMSEESLKTIVFAIKEASRLGLEVDLNLSSSWNAGGSWIGPQYSAKSLYSSKITIESSDDGDIHRSGSGKISLPFPEIPKTDSRGRPLPIEFAEDGKPVYLQEIAVLGIPAGEEAYLDTARILNLTAFFDPDTEVLNWKAPAGHWDIYRYVCSSSGEQLKLPSPNSAGPIIDHFDSVATRVHFMYFINKLRPLLGDFRKTGLKNFYLASFEATGNVWTPSMADEFRKINGYELYKFLPWFFDKKAFDSIAAADFERDFNLTVSELMINNHYRKGSEIARGYGLNLISESGGPGPPLHNVPVEALKALGALGAPRGEFWVNHTRYDGRSDSIDLLMLVKEIAAASHIYGRKTAELESFTSFQNWQEGPGDMKPWGDRAFCEGMSRVVIHGFTHNPEGSGSPGIFYHAGTHYNDKNTWWPKSKPFNDYLSRISYIFQEADFTADVLYYYGDKTPNFATPKNTRFAVGSGYDYEIINTEILLRDLDVKDGKLVLPGGAQFQVLALGEITGNIPGVWEKLQELALKGAIIVGDKPEKIPVELPADGWLAPAGSALSKTDLARGKGKILFNVPPLKILDILYIRPDFDYLGKGSRELDFQDENSPLLDYIHYRMGSLDFYFIRNTSDKWVSRSCSFRQQDKSPEYWDPVSGQVAPIPVYEQDGQQISLPLTLAPYGSCFVVFRKENGQHHYERIGSRTKYPPMLAYTEQGMQFLEKDTYELINGSASEKIENRPGIFPVTGAWQLTFPAGWGAPDSVTFPELVSWTESRENGIRYFSGTGTYHKAFRFVKDIISTGSQRVYLDLGMVSEVAEVWLNDQPLGISWTLPFRYDITDVVKQGKNTLKIEIANTWSNRIAGDAKTGGTYTRTNLTVGSSKGVPWEETPLIESGLLGPVTIQVLETVKVTKGTAQNEGRM